MSHTLLTISLAMAAISLLFGFFTTLRFDRLRRQMRTLEHRHDLTRAEQDILRRRNYALAAEAKMVRSGRVPRFAIEFRSEFGEDTLLWEIFEGQMEGYFIEAGAHDGFSLSVTYAFEAMGWTGLLVEAMPARARQCAARRTRSQVVHAALGPKSSNGTTMFTMIEGDGLDFLSAHTPGEAQVESIKKRGGKPVPVEVPLRSMNDVLAGHLGGIDFAVLDLQGGETDALRGFDLGHFRPRVLLIEDVSSGRNTVASRFLTGAGYTACGWVGYSQVFVRNDEREMIRRARESCSPRPLFVEVK